MLKDYTGAIADYDEAIRLDPKNSNAFVTRGKRERDAQGLHGAR